MQNKVKPNFIILLIICLLMILLLCIIALMILIQLTNSNDDNSINIGTNNLTNTPKNDVQRIIESYGSEYIDRQNKIMVKIYIDSKCDLFDENGKSNEKYFHDMVEEIAALEQKDFYLIDENKNIEIYVIYDKNTEKFEMKINGEKDFYKNIDSMVYNDLSNIEIAKLSDLVITNKLVSKIASANMYYARTMLTNEDRELLPNGYYTYENGTVLAKLNAGKVLNIVFNEDYEEEIAKGIYTYTKLRDIEGKFSNLAFGSVKDGYLAYRNKKLYVFFYGDEVSIYDSQYEERTEFDEYLSNYCATGDLEKLANDFTINWTNYFDYEYDAELQSLYITYPSRGIEINIKNNDSKGITIYNNYYLTDTVKELIKLNKITLENDKNLVLITEQKRRESMK